MLAALGFITVLVMLVLIMTKKASPLVALIAVPVITGIIACAFIEVVPEGATEGVVDFVANFKSLGGMITGSDGIGSVAATGVMFIFSILFSASSPMPAPSAPSSAVLSSSWAPTR